MKGPQLLQHNSGVLRTSVGAAFPGSHAVYRGKNLHRDLQQLDWVALYAYGVIGRHLAPEQLELVQALWVSTSYPDSRLWNNRVAALAGNARSSVNLGMIAGVAVSEATVYGGNAALRSMRFLQTTLERVRAGEALADIVWGKRRSAASTVTAAPSIRPTSACPSSWPSPNAWACTRARIWRWPSKLKKCC